MRSCVHTSPRYTSGYTLRYHWTKCFGSSELWMTRWSFASGDPLFFGFANTIQREIPDVEMQVFPYFNSLQLLAHRLLMPYQGVHVVSLTGRPWLKFDEALIIGYDMVGVLTDNRVHTPSAIAQRMLEYGYDNYEMYVGRLLREP